MLTPLEIESKVFNKSFSGYNVKEVKRFMKDILGDYEKMYRENIELKDKLNVLNEGIQYYKTIEETLQNALVLAEKTAEETKVVAKHKAEQIEKEAELKALSVINTAKQEVYKINGTKEELIKKYDITKNQITNVLKTQLDFVEKNAIDIHASMSSLELLLEQEEPQDNNES